FKNSSEIWESDPFAFSAYCILPQSHIPLRREGRERAAQPTFRNKKTKQGNQPLRRGDLTSPRRFGVLCGLLREITQIFSDRLSAGWYNMLAGTA
ncbi:MAG: hypothetical protein IKX16_08860, partial [Clostridia bacterium]|nr:hypothetical protein [Clostridia bacterium]